MTIRKQILDGLVNGGQSLAWLYGSVDGLDHSIRARVSELRNQGLVAGNKAYIHLTSAGRNQAAPSSVNC